jgi:secreted trypsin-like serine protease
MEQRTGGACEGDSGSPIFDSTDSSMVVAVQSFSLGPRATCSIAGGYRVDGEDDLAFLAEFGIAPAG